jgi:molecular chaperone HtpG
VFITDDADILPPLLALCPRDRRFRRPAAQHLARDDPAKPDPHGHRQGREPAACLPRRKSSPKRNRTAYAKLWDNFGVVLKEGLYEDFERRDALLSLSRFKTSTSGGAWRSLKDYVARAQANQTAIYFITGDDLARLEASPHLEGFRARGVEVLLLTDPIDSFWVMTGASFDGKPFKSVTQGSADLALIPLLDPDKGPGSGDQPERDGPYDFH